MSLEQLFKEQKQLEKEQKLYKKWAIKTTKQVKKGNCLLNKIAVALRGVKL